MTTTWAPAAALAAAIGIIAASTAQARISGPYEAGNLSVFLVHADPEAGIGSAAAQYLTLAEALASGEAAVYETGDVNQLEVQNLSTERTLFIQAGDIVKGGRQDRVLSVDLVLPPGSEKTSIAAFCVEQGRWSARGAESAEEFASAAKSLAGRDLKLAATAARSQQRVWDAVAAAQAELAASVGADVASSSSPTSLQLTLESEEVEGAIRRQVSPLATLAERHDDAIGYVYAVNGRISGGDIYASPVLFGRLWPRLLEASATEAVAERLKESAISAAPTADDAGAFLAAIDAAEPRRQQLPAGVTLISRDTDAAAALETRSTAAAGWIHRSYVAK